MAQTIDPNKLQQMGFYVDLGDVKSAEERWWRAVLAPGQGWHAIVQRPQFYSPWSVSYTGEYTFLVASSASNSSRCGLRPPSFQHAYNYLLKFCRRHNLGGQAYVALAATLILPLLNLLRRQARLLAPTSTSFCKSTATVLLKSFRQAKIFGGEGVPLFLSTACPLTACRVRHGVGVQLGAVSGINAPSSRRFFLWLPHSFSPPSPVRLGSSYLGELHQRPTILKSCGPHQQLRQRTVTCVRSLHASQQLLDATIFRLFAYPFDPTFLATS